MIKVKSDSDGIIIKGHSGYAESGYDIVCAGVSSIATTSINAILALEPDTIACESKEGFIEIKILKHEEITEKLISNMLKMLKDLSEEYPKNIKIERK